MEEIVRRFIDGEQDVYLEYVVPSTTKMKEFHNEIKRQVRDKDKKYYYYLVTFTLKTGINPETYNEIEKYILQQVKRKALKIVEAEYVREYTKNNIPHWHIAIKSEKYIAKNRFNYYVKKFGNIDISKSTIKSLSESLNYINKSQQSIKLI